MEYSANRFLEPTYEIELSNVRSGQTFILSTDKEKKNPEVYMKLETHGTSWSFLRISDMKQYSAFDLKWSVNSRVFVSIVDIIRIEVGFKLEPVRRKYETIVSDPAPKI